MGTSFAVKHALTLWALLALVLVLEWRSRTHQAVALYFLVVDSLIAISTL